MYSKSDYDAPTVVEAFDVKLRGNGNSAAEEKEFNGDVEDDKDEAENTDDDDDNCKECEDEELGEDMVFPVSEDSGELASVSESGKKEILIGMFVVLLVYSCVMIGNCTFDFVIKVCRRRSFNLFFISVRST